MTLVSTKYTGAAAAFIDALEILIPADVWHRSQRFRKASVPGLQQSGFKQSPVFSLRTAAMLRRSPFQGGNYVWIEIAYDEVCHAIITPRE
jgi:hypothetical protein